MPRYNFSFWVRYFNGGLSIEADNEDHARRIFDDMSIEELVSHTSESCVILEDIEFDLEDYKARQGE